MDIGSDKGKVLEVDPRYGSCASRILLSDQRDRIEACGLSIYRDGLSCGRGRLSPADQYTQSEEVFCASGCCSLLRREMLREIGEFDEDFFMYGDDTDMGWRQQLAGWKCIYTPHAVAYHAHSRAAGSYSNLKAFHVERNRVYICLKHFPLGGLLLSCVFADLRMAHQLYYAVFRKKGALAEYRKQHNLLSGFWILIRAYWSAFLKLHVMWRKRREIKKLKKISNQEISALFKRYGISTQEMAGYE